MPTAAVTTWTNQKIEPYYHPDTAKQVSVRLGASLNLAKGTVLGMKTSDSKFYAYSNAASDGTEVARCILPYAVQTDASGNITLSSTASQAGGEHAQKLTEIPVYVTGFFRTTELTGLDAAGVTDLGRIVLGALADGVLLMS